MGEKCDQLIWDMYIDNNSQHMILLEAIKICDYPLWYKKKKWKFLFAGLEKYFLYDK